MKLDGFGDFFEGRKGIAMMMSGLTQQQQKGKSGFWMGRRGCTVATSRENGSGGGRELIRLQRRKRSGRGKIFSQGQKVINYEEGIFILELKYVTRDKK